jgi:GNAT superfamily N-acetyltransferase
MVLSAAYTLLPIQPDSAALGDAVAVYCAVWQRDAAEAFDYFSTHTHYPHFHGVVVYFAGQPVGVGFGNQSLPGQWWHDRVAARLGAVHPMLQQAWLLSELAILPEHRNQHLGSYVHDVLVHRAAFPTLLLTTQTSNMDAQRFYGRHGWRVLHHGFAFHPGHSLYRVLYRQCPATA